MVFHGRRTVRIRRGLVGAFLLLFSSVLGAEDRASIDFSPDRVVRGGRFTVQIRTSIPWGEEVDIQRPDLVGPMVWWAYPYARPWIEESTDGTIRRMIEVLGTIRLDAPGFFLIGPFRISAGDRSVVTEPKEVIGLEADEANYPFPVSTLWRSAPEEAWRGQALSIVLEARNLVSLALADSVTLTAAPNGLLEAAPGLGSIITRPYGDDILYDVPVGSWIWTPSTEGEQRFPSARATVAGLNRAAPAFTTLIRPLPEAVGESGAVGQFRLVMDLDDPPYTSGEIISVRVRVEGEGNLNVLRLPVPELMGSTQVGRGTSSAYIPGPEGYEGWREERYDFQITGTGRYGLRLPGWAWLEPEGNGRVLVRNAIETEIEVEAMSADSITVDENIAYLGAQMFRYRELRFHWRESVWFLLALPGTIVVIILFLFRRPLSPLVAGMLVLPLLFSSANQFQKDEQRAEAAKIAIEAGNFDEAAEIYQGLQDTFGSMPGLLHDMAIFEIEKGNADKGILLMRRALLLSPGIGRISTALENVETRLGLDSQILPQPAWSPAIAFAVWLISINVFFLVLYRFLYHRKAGEAILFISVLFILSASSIFVGITENRWRSPSAVVSVDAQPLRKIPGPLAADWIKLPAGTAVGVTAIENDDCLVRTGYGLEGWLPKSSLLFIKEEANIGRVNHGRTEDGF